jgi:integrase
MKVGIQTKEGRLILAWNDGKRRTMAIGMPDSPPGRALAEKTKAEIEWDWRIGQYDPSLLKYRPRTLGKNASDITTAELFERFSKHQQRSQGLAQSSIEGRYQPIRRMLEKHLLIAADGVGRKQAEAFADLCDRTLSPATARARVALLKSAWDWAAKTSQCQLPQQNPWDGIGDRWSRYQQPKSPAAFTAAEVTRIIAGFRNSPHYAHYADFVFFQLNLATRPGEAIGLKWRSVSDDFSEVWIGESYYRGTQGPTKTRMARTVKLGPAMANMLRARKERLNPKPDDYVFASKSGGPIDDHNFRTRAWAKVLESLGIPYRKPYTTRKTCITHSPVQKTTPTTSNGDGGCG